MHVLCARANNRPTLAKLRVPPPFRAPRSRLLPANHECPKQVEETGSNGFPADNVRYAKHRGVTLTIS